ncbi:MAG: hypothetical protein QOE11_1747 [Solirubrobacteraceae bacterium]|jgi:hypothetical protein|nr:hypothetical protein [Solirubrobacteraceae bacterium]
MDSDVTTIGIFAAARSLLRSSVRTLWCNKPLLVFPALAVVLAFVAFALVVAPGLVAAVGTHSGTPALIGALGGEYAALCAVVFCNVALVSCAGSVMAGEPVSVAAGLRCATRRLPLIFGWAAALAIVHLVLRILERQGWIGRWLRRVLGALWSFATFFVVPVIVYENPPLRRVVAASLEVMRRSWGASSGTAVRLLWVVVLLVGAPVFGLLVLLDQLAVQTTTDSIVTAAMLTTAVAAVIGSSLDQVARTALYAYATDDRVAEGFDRSALHSAIYGRRRARLSA